jgi:hypothetical protein
MTVMTKRPPDQWLEWFQRNDLSFFAERVLGMEVSTHHKSWSKIVAQEDKMALEAPRDHGKSFFFSFAYPIWRAYYNWIPQKLRGATEFKSIPRVSIGYIFSNTQDQAIKLLDLVKREIEENPKLHWLIPEVKDVWSKTEIKLSNGAIIRARGWGVSVRGAHPVWIVADDCLNDESIYSELTRNKQIDYFYSAVTPMLVPYGQLIVVGTPFHQEDLYFKLENNRAYFFKKFPAFNDRGEALWPTRYNKEMLEKRKDEVGSTRFSREYLCNAISDEASLFPDYIIQSACDNMYEMPTFLTEAEKREMDVFMGVDLALSSTVGADFTVITTIGVDQYKNRWLLDINRKKGLSMNEQLRNIQEVARVFKPQKIIIESNGFQRVFADTLISNTDLPIEPFTTTAVNKNNAERGVLSLQVLFENKKIIIPRKTERCRAKTDPLIHELRSFSFMNGKLQGLGAHDDCVMSLWLCNVACDSSPFNFKLV